MCFKKSKIFILFVLFIFIYTQFEVYASSNYITFDDHILTGGVGNYGYSTRYYYVDSSALSYSTIIPTAVGRWVNTSTVLTTPISVHNTSIKSSSVIDVYATTNKLLAANAYTSFFRYSSSIDPMISNWGWTEITINKSYCNSSFLSTQEQIGVLAHELGHCFGLNENNNNKNSIMCQSASGRLVTSPQYCDLLGINYLYK